MTPLLFAARYWRIILIAVLVGAVGVQTWRIDRLKAQPIKTELRAAKQVIARTERADAITQNIGESSQKAQVQIRTVTRTIIEKVPQYVSAPTDHSYPVPWGLVRLYDASALGLDPAVLPNPAGQPDDAASSVAASDLATVAAGNNGQCREEAQRLTDLQQWVRDQQALWSKP